MEFMETISKIKNYLKNLELWLLIIFLGTMILLSFLQIITRKVFHSSIDHADQIISMSVFYIALTGASLATLEDKHITIEVLSNFVSDKINLIMAVFFNLFSMFIVYKLYEISMQYLELQSDSIDFFIGTIKTITVESYILPGFIMIGLGFFLNFIESLFLLKENGGK
jgi:TRAP-type C4-dicarboxylate transport system permease small subunit